MKTRSAVTLLLGVCAVVSMSSCGTPRWVERRFHAKPIENENAMKNLETKYADLIRVQEELEWAFKTNAVNSAEATRRRDVILNDLIRISDHHYDSFKHSSFIDNAGWNTGFDLTSIGLSSAATLVGGPAAQALSAADTGIKAAQGKINERWLSGRTIPVLVATMDSMRAETLREIYLKMGKRFEQFGIGEGIRLVAKYHQQASLLEAMNRLAAQADAAKLKNEDEAAKALLAK